MAIIAVGHCEVHNNIVSNVRIDDTDMIRWEMIVETRMSSAVGKKGKGTVSR